MSRLVLEALISDERARPVDLSVSKTGRKSIAYETATPGCDETSSSASTSVNQNPCGWPLFVSKGHTMFPQPHDRNGFDRRQPYGWTSFGENQFSLHQTVCVDESSRRSTARTSTESACRQVRATITHWSSSRLSPWSFSGLKETQIMTAQPIGAKVAFG